MAVTRVVISVAIAIQLNQIHSKSQIQYIKRGSSIIFKKNEKTNAFQYDFVSQLDCKIEFAKNINTKNIDDRNIIFIYCRESVKKSHSAQRTLKRIGFKISQKTVSIIQSIIQKERLSQIYFFIFVSFFSQIAFETSTETHDHIQNQDAIIKKKIGKLTLTAASASDDIAQAK